MRIWAPDFLRIAIGSGILSLLGMTISLVYSPTPSRRRALFTLTPVLGTRAKILVLFGKA